MMKSSSTIFVRTRAISEIIRIASAFSSLYCYSFDFQSFDSAIEESSGKQWDSFSRSSLFSFFDPRNQKEVEEKKNFRFQSIDEFNWEKKLIECEVHSPCVEGSDES